MNKQEIAKILEETASLPGLKGENPFRVCAYLKGAQVLLNLGENLTKIINADAHAI